MDLFDHVQRMGPAFFDRNSTGRLLTRLTNDVEALSDLVSGVVVNLFRDLFMVVGIVGAMVLLDPSLALVSLSCVPLIVVATVVYRIAARKNFVKVKALVGRINGFLAENISGMKLVQIFHREKEKHRELEDLDREFARLSVREVVLNSFSRPLVDIITNLTIAVLVWYSLGGAGSGALEVGVLYAFITYIRQFFEPISTLADQYTTIQSALVSASRISEVLNTTAFTEDLESGLPVPELRGEVEFRHVWFAYEGENWILQDVSFTVTPGQTAAFVGTTGSGKSTILSLLVRFYDIQRGEILVDGVPVREWNLAQLRRRIGVVIQDVFLFAGSVASNLRLHEQSIGDDELREAVRLVGADAFVDRLPSGWDEPVRERGATFSAGQRQLLSFARAVAFRPSILVLDEATANIDTESEALILRAMEAIRRGRTTIVVAHRLSTIRHADRIHVLKDGKIVESGTHRSLLAKKGAYAHAYHAQRGSTGEEGPPAATGR
jgi:ATP-binding cassette subfamily B protein